MNTPTQFNTALTDEQITAGANVLCDCPKPKRIGRNAAINVIEAMAIITPAAAAFSTDAATIATWRERIGAGTGFPLHAPTEVERAMVAEITELRVQLAQLQRVHKIMVDTVRDLGQPLHVARDMVSHADNIEFIDAAMQPK